MTRVIGWLAAGAVVLSGRLAPADIVNWSFPIDTFQEVPAPDVDGLDPLPSGFGMIEFDTTTNLLNWDITYSNLSGPIVAPGAHFHGPAPPGVPTGIQIFLTDGDPPEPTSGNLVGSATLTAEQASDLLAGLWYVNLHTARNPAGEIRGQVIPEPTTALLGCFAVAMACGIFRRSHRRTSRSL